MDWSLVLAGTAGGVFGVACFLIADHWTQGAGVVSYLFGASGTWTILGKWFTSGEQVAIALVGLIVFFGLGFGAKG